MAKLRVFRQCAFLAFFCATLLGTEHRVVASMGDDLEYACGLWESGEGYACTDCSMGGSFGTDWEASGNCDFSGIEDEFERLNTAANYCGEIMDGFDSTCETEYDDYMATWHENHWPESDPCFQALKTPSCWITWAQASCNAGPESTWAGDCNAFFWCEC